MNVVTDEEGNLVADTQGVLKRWKDHFSKLLNVHEGHEHEAMANEVHTAERYVPKPSMAETVNAIHEPNPSNLRKKYEFNQPVHMMFVDFEKAYDSVIRCKLNEILINFGIPKKLVRLVRMCMAGSQGGVRLGNELSEFFPIHNGLRQGDALSPLLFNFALEYAIEKIGTSDLGLSLNGNVQVCTYADDIAEMGDTEETVAGNTEILMEASNQLGVKVNVYQSFTVAGKSFERVKEFAYLGALITDRNYIKSELEKRTRLGNACYYSVQKLLATRLLSKKAKLIIY
jgi:hypothetical protein